MRILANLVGSLIDKIVGTCSVRHLVFLVVSGGELGGDGVGRTEFFLVLSGTSAECSESFTSIYGGDGVVCTRIFRS